MSESVFPYLSKFTEISGTSFSACERRERGREREREGERGREGERARGVGE
jgi:hypothetical protein